MGQCWEQIQASSDTGAGAGGCAELALKAQALKQPEPTAAGSCSAVSQPFTLARQLSLPRAPMNGFSATEC